ncbi:hypothetical protein GCM10018785_69490 [Streptomyces longispororuber]|uniref:Uncharacterized protein n=1 Tax=Streptomyces longispororuber TaxID=68230 RepID=A0A919A9C0_9ACTN|nr:hypothetical protein GCM10018785_69490 [Streptomyces longispororuber]
MERGTDPLPVTLNRAAETSASSGTRAAGSSAMRGVMGTSAVIARVVIAVSKKGRGMVAVVVTPLTDRVRLM